VANGRHHFPFVSDVFMRFHAKRTRAQFKRGDSSFYGKINFLGRQVRESTGRSVKNSSPIIIRQQAGDFVLRTGKLFQLNVVSWLFICGD
jgi:hypothetical protein